MAEWLKPIYNHIGKELLAGDYIQADETPVRVCDPDYGEKKSRQAYLCGYSRPGGNVYFTWSMSRSREGITRFLEGFEGVLQCDAYAAYLSFAADRPGIVLAGCMAHARRKFHEALPHSPRQAGEILAIIAELYRVEGDIAEAGLDEAATLDYRREHSRPVFERLHQAIVQARSQCLPQSTLGKACDYALAQWQALGRYLGHGRVRIDNNLMENAIRPSCVGKKNWLFVGHPNAGERPAILYSILGSCRRAGVDPQAYLRHVLSIDTRALGQSELAALTPAAWKRASDCSDPVHCPGS